MSVNGSNNFLNIEDANLRVRNGSVHAQGMTIGGAIVSASHGLQSVSDTSNTTSNTLQFTNATTAFKATSNIELTSASKIIVESNVLMDFKTLGQIEFPGSTVEQEYPPGPMSANESVIAGHGIFKARSSPNTSPNLDRQPWNAFDDDLNYGFDSYHGTADYDTNGNYTANTGVTLLSGGGTYLGEFLEIELPYPIKLRTNQFYPLQFDGTTYLSTYGIYRFFREALILGSNDGLLWNTLQSISETSYSFASEFNEYITVDTNSQTYYKYFRVAVNKVIGGTPGNRLNINEWRLFGTPGPTTLDKGSLTLGRSLDVPRVSRYDVDTETPRPEKLLVDFDTTVNSSPTDISGKGNHGTFKNNASYSAPDKAFKFSAAGHYIQAELNNSETGNQYHSVSLWFKITSGQTSNWRCIFECGENPRSGTSDISLYIRAGQDQLSFSNGSGHMYSDTLTNLYFQWHHIVLTYDGANRKMYLDGVLIKTLATTSWSGVANMTLRIGRTNANGEGIVNGLISNFKLYWQTALEPSEVQKLYRLGRTGRSMVISDTAVGIGKVPEAQLDVRGTSGFDAIKVGIPKRGDGHTASLGRIVVATPIGAPDRSFASGSVYTGIRIVGTDATNNLSMGVGNSGYNWEPWIQAAYDNSTTSTSDFGNKTLRLQPRGGSTTTNGSTVSSDDRVKVDETYIVNATETLMKLKPQTYTRYAGMIDKSRPDLDSWKRYEAGLITQEVHYDAPELRHIVNMSDDADLSGEDIKTSDDPSVDPDYRNWGSSVSSLDYTQLIPYLIKSNQEQEEEIRVLSAVKEKAFLQTSHITLLQNVVFSLTKRIEQLEQA